MAKYQITFTFYAVILLIVLTSNQASAECCREIHTIYHYCKGISSEYREYDDRCRTTICQNGEPIVGHYCAYGSCNIFGCNCDGGCITNPEGSWERAEYMFLYKYNAKLWS